MVYNMRQNRKSIPFANNQELVKYIALEGSSLTLLGLVKYDAAKDRFEMTELFSLLAGGIEEVKRCLGERIEVLNEASNSCLFVGGALLGIAVACTYVIWHDARMAREARERERNPEAAQLQAPPR